MSKFKVGDIVKGISNNYLVTDKGMTKGKVVQINCNNNEWWMSRDWKDVIKVEVVEHAHRHLIGGTYVVNSADFELVNPDNDHWIVIIEPVSDTTTVGKLVCGGDKIKEVTTKKHPDDEYNRDEAIRVICDRLVGEKKEEPPKPKYYNGKMVCVDNGHLRRDYTVGKIYTVVDGRFKTDHGEIYPPITPMVSVADWNDRSAAEWIEVVEE